MRAVVVYESMFGNTKQVAEAVAAGIAETMPVDLFEVGRAPTALKPDVGLVVIGAPTHAFSLSRPATRDEAAKRAPAGLVSPGIGAREWLGDLDIAPGTPTAAFCTRVKVVFAGSAAKAAARLLRKARCTLAAPPKDFTVVGTPGPLAPGELERARRWAGRLARAAACVPE
ncbi:flavodoxin family protein [Glycomyces endophyticus]|uniref:Flavodoxin family protein n=1 Tax=Glycomyces endophyticus TaxID=480996 RepID=A0ABN2GSX1_9ACTN